MGEALKEMKAAGSDDEKNLEQLAEQDGDDSKDSKTITNSHSAPSSGTGMTGATGAAALKKQKLLREIKTGDLTDAIANAKSPELRIALEAKQRELKDEKAEVGSDVLVDNNSEKHSDKKKKETRYPRSDVQLD